MPKSLWLVTWVMELLLKPLITVSIFYRSLLEPGKDVKINYLNDNNIVFVFIG